MHDAAVDDAVRRGALASEVFMGDSSELISARRERGLDEDDDECYAPTFVSW